MGDLQFSLANPCPHNLLCLAHPPRKEDCHRREITPQHLCTALPPSLNSPERRGEKPRIPKNPKHHARRRSRKLLCNQATALPLPLTLYCYPTRHPSPQENCPNQHPSLPTQPPEESQPQPNINHYLLPGSVSGSPQIPDPEAEGSAGSDREGSEPENGSGKEQQAPEEEAGRMRTREVTAKSGAKGGDGGSSTLPEQRESTQD